MGSFQNPSRFKSLIVRLKLFYLLDFLRKYRFFHYRFHHPYRRLLYKSGKVKSVENNHEFNEKILDRLFFSIKNIKQYIPTGEWKDISSNYKTKVYQLLHDENFVKIKEMLSDPLSNDLMYGFDNLSKSLRSRFRIETISEIDLTADHFLALAEYTGNVNYQSPESLVYFQKKKINLSAIIDEMVRKIFGRSIYFPNLYIGERGLNTNFGIASLRVPSAIYQAIQAVKMGANICEIGPGLGRTAYFANLLGAKKYTLVDLPISCLSSGYFLINSLPGVQFSFSGEDDIEEGIEFRDPNIFFEGSSKYDLILNVDSLTEIGIDLARKYLKEVIKRANYFFSINHEGNEFTVRKLAEEFNELKLLSRSRSWIRPGYVEEIFAVQNTSE